MREYSKNPISIRKDSRAPSIPAVCQRSRAIRISSRHPPARPPSSFPASEAALPLHVARKSRSRAIAGNRSTTRHVPLGYYWSIDRRNQGRKSAKKQFQRLQKESTVRVAFTHPSLVRERASASLCSLSMLGEACCSVSSFHGRSALPPTAGLSTKVHLRQKNESQIVAISVFEVTYFFPTPPPPRRPQSVASS